MLQWHVHVKLVWLESLSLRTCWHCWSWNTSAISCYRASCHCHSVPRCSVCFKLTMYSMAIRVQHVHWV